MTTYRHENIRYCYDPYIRLWCLQNLEDDNEPCKYCYDKKQLKQWHPEFKFVKEIEPESYL